MFSCTACSAMTQKWVGKCPNCGEWNTLIEAPDIPKRFKKSQWNASTSGAPIRLIDADKQSSPSERTQMASSELNNVLGGGLVHGSFLLLSGEPGIGKSTLSLQIADWHARGKKSTLYVSGEETTDQIVDRALRLKINNQGIRLAHATSLEDALTTIASDDSSLVVVDSASVLGSQESGGAGTPSQIRSVAESLLEVAKRGGKSVLLIGHVTKDGSISGPKALEHLVDAVLFLEGSPHEDYRILRVLKNRFGPTDTIALFRMSEEGMIDMSNPGVEFVDGNRDTLVGSALAMTMEWGRPLLIEIEALTASTKFGYPKRSSRGISQGKTDLIIAALMRHGSLSLDSSDVYANIARGLSVSEPGLDLALAAAIISSRKNVPLHKKIWIGELSLTGRIKNVHRLKARIDEAIKLGFDEIIIPVSYEGKHKDATLKRVGTVADLVKEIGGKKIEE